MPLCPRGGYPGFLRSEGHVLSDTCSSFVEEAIEVPVVGESLSVQGPVLWTVDCPSGVCSSICVGSLPRDLSSQVPGRLADPRFFGVGGQKKCPGSALALSLHQDSDKRGEVRSCTLADCKLSRCDHRYWGRQDFSVPCAGQEISVGGGDVLCFVRSPRSTLTGGFGSPGFTREIGSSQSTSNALSVVAFEDALVSRVGSSFSPGTTVPGGVLVDGAGPSFQGGSVSGHLLWIYTCTRTLLGRGGAHISSIVTCLGCGQRRRSCCTSVFSR